ncbi:hypothetical protein I553_10573 [Mycobacterium xenopi 4042]|uniref:Uncharacterized protein n=1 Tax=Mycobacterium xenopi 4042 TaxID=1299334 RepID=X7ZFZ8_MYCXE|nr:hypothetical protein I553_10573 [Mycobacterium xenopi 4042]
MSEAVAGQRRRPRPPKRRSGGAFHPDVERFLARGRELGEMLGRVHAAAFEDLRVRRAAPDEPNLMPEIDGYGALTDLWMEGIVAATAHRRSSNCSCRRCANATRCSGSGASRGPRRGARARRGIGSAMSVTPADLVADCLVGGVRRLIGGVHSLTSSRAVVVCADEQWWRCGFRIAGTVAGPWETTPRAGFGRRAAPSPDFATRRRIRYWWWSASPRHKWLPSTPWPSTRSV